MKNISLFILTLLFSTLCATAKSKQIFFAKTVAQSEGIIHINDSILVSVYLYAKLPIGDVEINDKKLRINGCTVHRLYQNNGRRQSITKLDGESYYTVLCAQYAVAGYDLGKCSFPALQFTANLYKEEKKQQENHSGSFFNPFESFFRQPTYTKEKVTTRSEPLKMQVAPAKPKTSEQLKKMGKTVI